MAVAFEEPPPLDLRETSQPFDLELLQHLLELREVLLDARVRQVGERLRAQHPDYGPELAHGPRSSNICSDATRRL
jgi:hypothetical protein